MRHWWLRDGIQLATSCDPKKQQTALDSHRSMEACPLDDQLSQNTRRKQVERSTVVTTTGELSTRFASKANDAKPSAHKRRETKYPPSLVTARRQVDSACRCDPGGLAF